ncbi:MAG: hypothetical protein BGO27_01050 [Alphaproteobacteria bacterium 33-17]|nr:MAG: hypothetical protein BGO27_01050 [Alphaproteobacteria bacterium 33-17]
MDFKNQLLHMYKEMGVDEVTGEGEMLIEEVKQDIKSNPVDSIDNIQDLFEYINKFDGCSLKEFATNTVMYDGTIGAEILLIGEAPGAQEDLEGRPFCGQSGQLLDLMLKSIGLDRNKNVFITNNVFWRPPANRKPTDDELDICRPMLEKIIALINPKIIIAVGSVAAQNLTQKNYNMNQFREKPFEYINKYLKGPIKTYTIFHPAYLLRQPSQKKIMWFDLIKIEKILKNSNIKV